MDTKEINRYQIAWDKHRAGYNCCTCVLFAFQDYLGLSDEQCYAISSGLGGGLRMGEVCGAVTGAVMVLGMIAPHDPAGGSEGKQRNMRLTKAFEQRFQEKQGAVRCRDLKPRAEQYRPAAGIDGGGNCDWYIFTAVEILEELIAQEEN